jgi:hypothetical protein
MSSSDLTDSLPTESDTLKSPWASMTGNERSDMPDWKKDEAAQPVSRPSGEDLSQKPEGSFMGKWDDRAREEVEKEAENRKWAASEGKERLEQGMAMNASQEAFQEYADKVDAEKKQPRKRSFWDRLLGRNS